MTFRILAVVSVDKRTSGSWLGPCETLSSDVSIGIRYSEMSLKDAENNKTSVSAGQLAADFSYAYSFPDNPRAQPSVSTEAF